MLAEHEATTQILNIVTALLVPLIGGVIWKVIGHGERLARFEGQQDASETGFQGLKKDMNKRFDAIDKRLDDFRGDIKELFQTKQDKN